MYLLYLPFKAKGYITRHIRQGEFRSFFGGKKQMKAHKNETNL